MLPENYWEIVLRLGLALVLGGIIGIERSGTNHDAGMRTHILVCLGASAIMVISQTMHGVYGGDIGRMGAQVVSGIGFLGAGCILISGNRIKGLTTAAGLWATAAVGLGLGMGYYFTAAVLTVFMLTATLLLHPVATRIERRSYRREFVLNIQLRDREYVDVVMDYLYEHHRPVTSAELDESGLFIVKIGGLTDADVNRLICELLRRKGIQRVERV